MAVDDDDVTSWTATLDARFANGRCLATVAVGNNGDADAASGNNRIQSIALDGVCLVSHVPAPPDRRASPIVPVGSVRLLKELSDIDLVVMTATEVERKTLHRFMMPLSGEAGLLEGAVKLVTYRVGIFGRYKIAHVECSPGGLSRQGATLTTHEAIAEARPKAILILGIAFGVNRRKQKLGDVLVASTILPYDLERVGLTITDKRGENLNCGGTLLERFRTRSADWTLPRGLEEVRAYPGPVLSGETLVDNEAFRDRLVTHFPTALGGEMEGAGSYAAASRAGVELILVKSICDWADGLKNDRAQPFAAFSAIHLAHHVMSREDALGALGCKDRSPVEGLSVEDQGGGGRAEGVSPGAPSAQLAKWSEVLELLQKDKRILRDDGARKWGSFIATGERPPAAVVLAAENLICSPDTFDDEAYRFTALLRERPPEDYPALVHRLTAILIDGGFVQRDSTGLAVAYEAVKFPGTVDLSVDWLMRAQRIGATMDHLLSALSLYLELKPPGYAKHLDALLSVGRKYREHSLGTKILEMVGDRVDQSIGISGLSLGESSQDAAKQEARAIILDLANEWASRLSLDSWKAWTSFLLSNDHPRMKAQLDRQLEELREWLLARVWPEGYEGVKCAFLNFHAVLRDFQETFRKYARPEGELMITEKFYQISEWDAARYDALAKQYEAHVDLVQDLVLELNRAANFVSDQVREAADSRFRMREGRAVVESGPTMEMRWVQLPAEYRGNERGERPYPGLSAFQEARFDRKDGFRFGSREEEE